MNPNELNVLITSITNYLYNSLSKDEFHLATIFVHELGRSMSATSAFSRIEKDIKEHKKMSIEDEQKKLEK